MNPRTVLELAGFQAVWLACALGAAHGWSAPGIAAAGVFVAAQLYVQGGQRALVAATLASGFAGLAAETLAIAAGLVRYFAHWPFTNITPGWMVALWLAFGSTIPTTARLLGKQPIVMAAGLGALFGPLAYAAGSKLGALQLTQPSWIAYLAIACCWSIAFPALIALARGAARP